LASETEDVSHDTADSLWMLGVVEQGMSGRGMLERSGEESVIVIIAVSNLIVIVIPQLSKVLCQFSSGGYDAARRQSAACRLANPTLFLFKH